MHHVDSFREYRVCPRLRTTLVMQINHMAKKWSVQVKVPRWAKANNSGITNISRVFISKWWDGKNWASILSCQGTFEFTYEEIFMQPNNSWTRLTNWFSLRSRWSSQPFRPNNGTKGGMSKREDSVELRTAPSRAEKGEMAARLWRAEKE